MFKFLKRNSTAPTVPDTTPAPSSNKIDFGWLVNVFKKQPGEFVEPWTLARARLEGNARDKGADAVRPMYNAHKTKVRNQWVNPLQSVNSGYSTVQMSFFLYQTVNYYECYALAQDPLFAKVFNLLSETPFSKGGEIVMPEDADIDRNALDVAVKKYDVWGHIVRGVRSSYVSGGCLVYMDFGLSPDELAKPLRLSNMDMRRFKGFRHIDPINVVALDVDTVNPVSADYMNPKQWYVIGLGNVHRSHFLKFEANIPELVMRPLTLYFGMPLTQLIKQDVANSNLASQGVANLMNRFRNLYLTMEDSAFATANAESLKSRLEFMSLAQDNFMVCPLKSGESVQQLTMSLTGVADNLEMFYLLVSAKTDIPYTELMGKSAQGMDASGAGDRRKWYDKCVSIQTAQHDTILTMYGICAGTIAGDGKFVKFPDYTFNPLEESSEKERAENLRSYTEVARTLIDLGATSEHVFNWLKSFADFHLDKVEFDADAMADYDDLPDDDPWGGGTTTNNGDFDESKVKRDDGGQFAKKPGGGSGSVTDKDVDAEKQSDDQTCAESGAIPTYEGWARSDKADKRLEQRRRVNAAKRGKSAESTLLKLHELETKAYAIIDALNEQNIKAGYNIAPDPSRTERSSIYFPIGEKGGKVRFVDDPDGRHPQTNPGPYDIAIDIHGKSMKQILDEIIAQYKDKA